MEKTTELKIRGLKTKDVFAMSRILKKMKIKVEIHKFDENGEKVQKTQAELGADIIMQVLENLGDAEDEVNAFMGSLVGLSADEFAELGFEESGSIIAQFKEMKGVKGFLSLAMKQTTQN